MDMSIFINTDELERYSILQQLGESRVLHNYTICGSSRNDPLHWCSGVGRSCGRFVAHAELKYCDWQRSPKGYWYCQECKS
jgi:hypothetical protein